MSSRALEKLSDEALLARPLNSLGLSIQGSPLEPRVEALFGELERAGLRFRPRVWLSTEWFSPNGVPGLAIPFYLAHPRLVRMEKRRMLHAEGSERSECMRLLRHEAGHAIDNGFRLRRRKRFRETFGSASAPYRATYVPNPRSKRFVHNLDSFYAQSHPIEDFAETFAVWLQPGSDWKTHYANWPARAKLEVVDNWMDELRDTPQPVKSRARVDPIERTKLTLAEYFERKQDYYRQDSRENEREVTAYYGLDRLFSADPSHRSRETGATFLRRYRVRLRERVSNLTGQHPFVVDQALREMIQAASKRGLRCRRSQNETQLDAVALLSARTMQFLVEGRKTYVR